MYSLQCDFGISFGRKVVEYSKWLLPLAHLSSDFEVIKLELFLRLKIKRNDWLLADTCPLTANHCALF